MANHKSALKRIRNSARKRARNRIVISRIRTEVRNAREAIGGTSGGKNAETKTLGEAKTATVQAVRSLDSAVSKGVLHKNNAARRKSRLMKRLAALESSAKK